MSLESNERENKFLENEVEEQEVLGHWVFWLQVFYLGNGRIRL
jgi:hypothetical protein